MIDSKPKTSRKETSTEYELIPLKSIDTTRNIWRKLPIESQLDVFKYVRGYHLLRVFVNVCYQWRGLIREYEEELPKFRDNRMMLKQMVGII
jgi:hypothetical protein